MSKDSVSTTTSLHSPPDLRSNVPDHVTIDIPSKVVVKVLLLIAVIGLSLLVLRELQSLLVQLAVATFLAVAADSVVRKLERRGLSRGRSVVLVLLAALGALALALWVFVPPLVEQGDRLIRATPEIVDDVRDSGWYHDVDERFDVVGKLSEQAEKLPGIVSDQLGNVFGAVAAGVFGTITILFLVIFLLTGGGQVVEGTVRVFPKLAERRWWSIIQGAYTGIASYVGGAIVIALCGGTVLTVTALILGLPYALPLGLWMMLLEIIPMIGATIGAIPAVIVAFVAGGTAEGIVMILVVIVYQQIENILIQPRVQGRAASLSPLMVFVSVLIGSQLLGILGALFAVPVAGVVQIFLRQLIDDQGSHEVQVPQLATSSASAPPVTTTDAASEDAP